MSGTNLKEPATVVALDGDSIWVQTQRQGTCNTCSASKGCGQGILNRLIPGRVHYIRALRAPAVGPGAVGPELTVGDQVEVSVPENMVLKSSVLVYLMPLSLLLAGALLGDRLWPGDPGAILGGLGGLLAGFSVVRVLAVLQRHNPALQPRVQRATAQQVAQDIVVRGERVALARQAVLDDPLQTEVEGEKWEKKR